MSKASEWDDAVREASEAKTTADRMQPKIEFWEPYALNVKARAMSATQVSIKTQQAEQHIILNRDSALMIAKWIIDSFGEP